MSYFVTFIAGVLAGIAGILVLGACMGSSQISEARRAYEEEQNNKKY